MGRAKLKMELISNERARRTTFHKRVKGLKKKMYEFSTLSDVKACLIIFGPKQGDTDNMVKPETWPENQNHVSDILSQFLKYDVKERGKREVGIEEFFKSQTEKLRAELDKLRRQNDQTKYPTWDHRLDHFSLDQLGTLSDQLDLKLELVKQKLHPTEGELELDFLEEAIGYFSASPDDLQQQPLSDYVKTMDQCLPLDCTSYLDSVDCSNFCIGSQQPLSDYVKTMDQCLPLDCTSYSDSVDCSNFCIGSSVCTDLPYIYDPSMDYFHPNSFMLRTLDHDEFVFNNSYQAGGYYIPTNIQQMPSFVNPHSYAMGYIEAAASSHHSSSMLPSLDQEIVFNNSSQAAGYYVPGDIQQMPSFFLNPQSYAVGSSSPPQYEF